MHMYELSGGGPGVSWGANLRHHVCVCVCVSVCVCVHRLAMELQGLPGGYPLVDDTTGVTRGPLPPADKLQIIEGLAVQIRSLRCLTSDM